MARVTPFASTYLAQIASVARRARQQIFLRNAMVTSKCLYWVSVLRIVSVRVCDKVDSWRHDGVPNCASQRREGSGDRCGYGTLRYNLVH